MVDYLDCFHSESVRAYLIPQIVADKVKHCEIIVLKSYMQFKRSNEYISAPSQPAPANIYVRYDNAFRTLKPKKIQKELLELVRNPRDAFYLPLTMRMTASWRNPELEDILISYTESENITPQSVGLPEKSDNYYPSLQFIRRELLFTALDGIKYYPSEKSIVLMQRFVNSTDRDISAAAKKSMLFLEKHTKVRASEINKVKVH